MRKLKWLAINGLFFTALIAGLVYGIEGAMNVVAAYVGFAFVVSLFVNSNESIKYLKERGAPAFPMWLNRLVDAAGAVLLVWHGHFFLAGLLAVSCLLCAAALDRAANEAEAA